MVVIGDQEETYEEEIRLLEKQIWRLEVLDGSFKGTVADEVRNASISLGKALTRARKVLAVAQSGYAEIGLPTIAGWVQGYVEDPRPYQRSYLPLALLVALGGMVLACVGFFLITSQLTVGRAIILLSLLPILVGLFLGIRDRGRATINRRALESAGMSPFGTLHFLKTPTPEWVQEKVREAKESGLFEEIRVTAPFEAFTHVTPNDPVIYGVVARQTFLIAQFGLTGDGIND